MRLRGFWLVFGGVATAAGAVGTWYGIFDDGVHELRLAQADQKVIGGSVVGNGGVGADISVTGSAGQPPRVGWGIQAQGAPGQSVTGLQVIQNGPGTGMRVTVGGDGPATGVSVTVTGR
jgi:hypothetical protein